MHNRWKRYWPAIKVLGTVVILFFVGRSLARDLAQPQLWQRSWQIGWLLVSALLAAELYVLGVGFSAFYWGLLLRDVGQHPTPLGVARGYYVGMLGKYVPGKAWALLLRATLVRNSKVRVGVAVQTAFFEVLLTMAAGALLATVLFALTGPSAHHGLHGSAVIELLHRGEDQEAALDSNLAILFSAALALPLLVAAFPAVFNRAVERMTLPFRKTDALPLPELSLGQYLQGLAFLFPCWLCLGGSFWIMLLAVMPQSLQWNWDTFGYVTAATAAAYVAGFVVLIAPSGLGVREWLLVLLLRPLFGGPAIALAVLAVRVVWTLAELLMAGALHVQHARAKA